MNAEGKNLKRDAAPRVALKACTATLIPEGAETPGVRQVSEDTVTTLAGTIQGVALPSRNMHETIASLPERGARNAIPTMVIIVPPACGPMLGAAILSTGT